jgi:hypothetical protein
MREARSCSARPVSLKPSAEPMNTGEEVKQEATDRLVSVLEADPEWVMGFMADFGGDTSDYLPLAEGEEIDFATITPEQVGNAVRQGIDSVPPEGLPPDLDLADVDWADVGARLDSLLMGFSGNL